MAREPELPIGVALVHPQPLVRLGVRQILEADGRYTVRVEVAQHADLAKAWVPSVQVALVYLVTPVQPVLEVVYWVREQKRAGVVVLGPVNELLAERLVVGGAHGLLPCDVAPDELGQAVGVAAKGGVHANVWMLPHMRGRAGRGRGTAERPPDLRPTRREAEVLRLMADPQRYTLAQIGTRLGMGLRTVESHRDALFAKFQVNDRHALLEKAQRMGWV